MTGQIKLICSMLLLPKSFIYQKDKIVAAPNVIEMRRELTYSLIINKLNLFILKHYNIVRKNWSLSYLKLYVTSLFQLTWSIKKAPTIN